MAEVSLLLEAEESSNLPEPYTALSEVAVTRRVYRSGDSEYLINKIPCRLKDITEFFMAAQIHSRGYALIEQGRIEEIIRPSLLNCARWSRRRRGSRCSRTARNQRKQARAGERKLGTRRRRV